MFTFSWLCFYFSIWRLPWPRGSVAASRLLLVVFYIWRLPWPRGSVAASRLLLVACLCMATAMAERQRRGIEALAYCFFLYGDCHGREAASRHRGSCLLLFSVWRLPWPRGSVAETLLLRHYLRLPINLCEPALIAFFYFYSSISSFCNLCFHSLYLSQRQ